MNEHCAIPPQLLVAVHITIVVPIGKAVPDGGTHVTGPVLPVALTVKLVTALALQVTRTRLDGHVIVTCWLFTR